MDFIQFPFILCSLLYLVAKITDLVPVASCIIQRWPGIRIMSFASVKFMVISTHCLWYLQLQGTRWQTHWFQDQKKPLDNLLWFLLNYWLESSVCGLLYWSHQDSSPAKALKPMRITQQFFSFFHQRLLTSTATNVKYHLSLFGAHSAPPPYYFTPLVLLSCERHEPELFPVYIFIASSLYWKAFSAALLIFVALSLLTR